MATRRLTISDIKYDTLATSPHFFDRKSMKFFGQTMAAFHVRKSPKGRIFIFAPMRDRGRFMGYSIRQYIPGKVMGHGELQLVRLPAGESVDSYIKAH